MRKIPRASSIADILHKGFVWGCLGLSAYGLIICGTNFYHYLNVTRPNRQALKEKLLQEDLPSVSTADPEELKS